jgi:hypothetical protein
MRDAQRRVRELAAGREGMSSVLLGARCADLDHYLDNLIADVAALRGDWNSWEAKLLCLKGDLSCYMNELDPDVEWLTVSHNCYMRAAGILDDCDETLGF